MDEDIRDFESAAKRPLRERLNYAFIKTLRPGMDNTGILMFRTMEEYREWCRKNLPEWMGMNRP